MQFVYSFPVIQNMGMKRPLEGDFPEPPFRLPKQLNYEEKLTFYTEEPRVTSSRVDYPGIIFYLIVFICVF